MNRNHATKVMPTHLSDMPTGQIGIPINQPAASHVPCVSVIIAARNAEATIATAAVSALSQPQTAEIIVIDDASDDSRCRRLVPPEPPLLDDEAEGLSGKPVYLARQVSLRATSGAEGDRVPKLGFLKPLMRKATLDAAGLRYDPKLRLGEDIGGALRRALSRHRAQLLREAMLRDALTVRRRHGILGLLRFLGEGPLDAPGVAAGIARDKLAALRRACRVSSNQRCRRLFDGRRIPSRSGSAS